MRKDLLHLASFSSLFSISKDIIEFSDAVPCTVATLIGTKNLAGFSIAHLCVLFAGHTPILRLPRDR